MMMVDQGMQVTSAYEESRRSDTGESRAVNWGLIVWLKVSVLIGSCGAVYDYVSVSSTDMNFANFFSFSLLINHYFVAIITRYVISFSTITDTQSISNL